MMSSECRIRENIGPNISVKQAPPLDSKQWEGKPDKFQYFLPNPGAKPLNEVSSSKSVRLHAGAQFDHAACPYSVTQAGHAFGLCAMVAAEERAFLFEAVTEDMNAAIVAGWSQRMDRALEAVEGVGGAVHAHLKRLVVVVSAGFASSQTASKVWRRVFTGQPAPGRP